MKTKNKSIKDLKKGDVVAHYGARFEILEDAKVLDKFFHPNQFFWAYIAKCKRIDNLHLGDINGLLNMRDHFKGTDSVKCAVIKNN